MALLEHRDREDRPWGSFERFTLNQPSTVKILRLNPEKAISLQSHAHRGEFWRILAGDGVVTIGGEESSVHAGDEVEIPAGTPHRLRAAEDGLSWLEIAIGDFAEEDETRISDDFGRADSVSPDSA